ncbi:ROK family protein [Lactobacillus sp. S2-2]|uniref:ROK family protein n=1 Tax=Lactobacillus sp. S2-2 TaxID=2692917 RepID=UPI001F216EE0|nr:ROK family protein [Lactobacillus sp. S2-2]MCF6515293.1 ROK family protein [Lactobacillus sp. S2-2]
MLLGSIEAGGTKFVCAVGDETYKEIDSVSFETTNPEETIGKCINYFQKFPELMAIGIASFGPIEVRINNPKYGYITDTPKEGWKNTNFLGLIKEHFDIPVYWTTDVNGSAYGEYINSINQKKPIRSLAYYTIGTGIGAGIVNNGELLGYMGHPEVGHVLVKKHPEDQNFSGVCPYHDDCLEGLASGPTFEQRTGKKGKDVPMTDSAWDKVAYYVAQAAMQVTLFIRPEKIIFGGGVVSEPFLVKVRNHFKKLFNNYFPLDDLNHYISSPAIKNNGSATIGNFALALKQYYKDDIVEI